MENKNRFVWQCRYSETEESDKHKRWARLCYYNNRLICWVSRFENDEGDKCYSIKDFFPSIQQDDPCFFKVEFIEKGFDIIKKEVEERFTSFIKELI